MSPAPFASVSSAATLYGGKMAVLHDTADFILLKAELLPGDQLKFDPSGFTHAIFVCDGEIEVREGSERVMVSKNQYAEVPEDTGVLVTCSVAAKLFLMAGWELVPGTLSTLRRI